MKRVAKFKIKKKIALGISLAFSLGMLSSVNAAEVIEVVDGATPSGTNTYVGLLGQNGYGTDTDFDITVTQPNNKTGIGIANALYNSPTGTNVSTGNNEIRITAGYATGISAMVTERASDSSTRTLETGDNIITIMSSPQM